MPVKKAFGAHRSDEYNGSDAKSPRKAHSNYIPFAWVIGLTLGITG